MRRAAAARARRRGSATRGCSRKVSVEAGAFDGADDARRRADHAPSAAAQRRTPNKVVISEATGSARLHRGQRDVVGRFAGLGHPAQKLDGGAPVRIDAACPSRLLRRGPALTQYSYSPPPSVRLKRGLTTQGARHGPRPPSPPPQPPPRVRPPVFPSTQATCILRSRTCSARGISMNRCWASRPWAASRRQVRRALRRHEIALFRAPRARAPRTPP